MGNNISFTGINNLYIGKKTDTRIGAYPDLYGNIKRGEKKYLTTKIKCNLTDDDYGKDLTDFRKALLKCGSSYQAYKVANTDISNLDFEIERCRIKDNEDIITNSNFKLNGISISPNDRKILPLFTYLAKLTRDMQYLPESSDEKNKYLRLANKSIQEEAMKFIDNMV